MHCRRLSAVFYHVPAVPSCLLQDRLDWNISMSLVLWLRVVLFLVVVVLPAYRFVRTLRLRRRAIIERGRGRVIVDESRVVEGSLVESDKGPR